MTSEGRVSSSLADLPPHPLTCPHGKDKGHGGLGKVWCDAGIEGAKYLRDREARVAAFLSAPARVSSDERGADG
jgi:hypothetical protein